MSALVTDTYQLYNTDNRQVQLGMETVDCIITSPPYGDMRTYEGLCRWDYEIFKTVAHICYQVLAQGGVMVWVVNDATINGSKTLDSFRQALYFEQIGFNMHDVMIYQKHNPTPNTGNGVRYQQSFEYMFVLSKGKPKTVNLLLEPRKNECNDKRTYRIKKTNRKKDGTFAEAKPYNVKEQVPRSNIWKYKVGLHNSTSDKIAFEHPAIFPEKLAEDHILTWTNEHDTVLDPFMGSGTVGKMCIKHNRKFIGIEQVKKYYDIAVQRITKYVTQQELPF